MSRHLSVQDMRINVDVFVPRKPSMFNSLRTPIETAQENPLFWEEDDFALLVDKPALRSLYPDEDHTYEEMDGPAFLAEKYILNMRNALCYVPSDTLFWGIAVERLIHFPSDNKRCRYISSWGQIYEGVVVI